MISVPLDDELKDETGESRLQGMVMEYIEGKDLMWHLRRNGIFSEEKALQIIKQIGSALEHIHSKGLLHRDIKPENIMLRESTGDAVLIDFGLARQFSFEEAITMTILMTKPFAPPEQFENKARFKPALDIYSLAATLFVLVAKKNRPYFPLPDATRTSLEMMRQNIPLKSPQLYNRNLSDQITQGILWGMEFEVEKRPQSVSEWLNSLQKPEIDLVEEAKIYFNRGLKHQNQNEYEKAIADYNKAIELNPNYVYAYGNRGISYKNLGKYELAIADYNKAIELNPKYGNAYNNRGVSYQNLEKYELAIADYNKAIELNPKHANAYNNRGNSYKNLGKYELAIADYNKAIELNSNDATAYNNRGVSYQNLEKYELAIADYNKAIELDPDKEMYQRNRDRLLEKMKSQ